MELSTLDGLAAADRWTWNGDDPQCGDIAISHDPVDATRFVVYRVSDGATLFGGHIPPLGLTLNDLAYFGSVLNAHEAVALSDQVIPVQGLGAWLDLAQMEAEVIYDEREDARRAEQASRRIGRRASDVLASVAVEPDWLIPGVIVRGWAHKIGGREKGGKGTFVFYLLGTLERGDDSAFGPATAQTTSLIYTEEPEDSVREKLSLFGLSDSTVVYGWELSHMDWLDKIKKLVEAAQADGHRLLFMDNVSRAAQVDDENGTELGRRVERLADACRKAGLTLIVDHHHKKGSDAVENKSRGGTALAGAVDVNLELERKSKVTSRVRTVTAIGRLRATNWVKRIALSDDGQSYELLAEKDDDGGDDEHTSPKVSRAEQSLATDGWHLEANPNTTVVEFAAVLDVSTSTALRRLNTLHKAGIATKTGAGSKLDPFRFTKINLTLA